MSTVREGEAEASSPPIAPSVAANVKYGLWAAVAADMGNLAIEEGRVVHWNEFFPDGEDWETSFEKDYPDPDPV